MPPRSDDRDYAPVVDGCTYFRLWPDQRELAIKAFLDRGIEPEFVDWAIQRQDRRMIDGVSPVAMQARGLPSHYRSLVDYMITEAETEKAQRVSNRRKLDGPAKEVSGGDKLREMVSKAEEKKDAYRDWETDRKSTRLNSSH